MVNLVSTKPDKHSQVCSNENRDIYILLIAGVRVGYSGLYHSRITRGRISRLFNLDILIIDILNILDKQISF